MFFYIGFVQCELCKIIRYHLNNLVDRAMQPSAEGTRLPAGRKGSEGGDEKYHSHSPLAARKGSNVDEATQVVSLTFIRVQDIATHRRL